MKYSQYRLVAGARWLLSVLFFLVAMATMSASVAANDQQQIATITLNADFTGVLMNALLPLEREFGSIGTISLVDFRYCGSTGEDSAKLLAIGSLTAPPSWLAGRRISQPSNVLQQADCNLELSEISKKFGSDDDPIKSWLAITPADAVVAKVSAQWTGDKISFTTTDLGFLPTTTQTSARQSEIIKTLKGTTFAETNRLSAIKVQAGAKEIILPSRVYFGSDKIVLAVSSASAGAQFPKLSDLKIESSLAPTGVNIEVPYAFANEFLGTFIPASPIVVTTQSAQFGDLTIVSVEIDEHDDQMILGGTIRDKDANDFKFAINSIVSSSEVKVDGVTLTPPPLNCADLNCLKAAAAKVVITKGLSILN